VEKNKLTRMQRYEAKRQELLNLKQELRKAKTPYKQGVLREEMKAVARQLAALQD